ncbi:hypothetical protein A946_02545 [Methylacidiphilum kamchatkense Kam1]|uniref:Uncharacterized protein n=1 Tax=Methylacidiphilum kamchatkense Kam1 TaxID=1202785 RepID=A0A0C1RVI5_9BACT|nr:hypothetical protein [Methylacidiphilum kamchatkense]KIE58956.1 hypothetical protein A946_02545 [Methylacidiphilum kamchatkense Kam1]QDQ43162.1 hypothetical protein kam1_1952 [Methylacidiphilum kamchatkense Kam1]
MKKIIFALVLVAFQGSWLFAAEQVTVKGELVDLVCYIDHAARGEKHMKCGRTCLNAGLPPGLKGEDGKLYIIVGEHKPIGKEAAKYADQKVTVKGKLVSADGYHLIEDAEIIP